MEWGVYSSLATGNAKEPDNLINGWWWNNGTFTPYLNKITLLYSLEIIIGSQDREERKLMGHCHLSLLNHQLTVVLGIFIKKILFSKAFSPSSVSLLFNSHQQFIKHSLVFIRLIGRRFSPQNYNLLHFLLHLTCRVYYHVDGVLILSATQPLLLVLLPKATITRPSNIIYLFPRISVHSLKLLNIPTDGPYSNSTHIPGVGIILWWSKSSLTTCQFQQTDRQSRADHGENMWSGMHSGGN